MPKRPGDRLKKGDTVYITKAVPKGGIFEAVVTEDQKNARSVRTDSGLYLGLEFHTTLAEAQTRASKVTRRRLQSLLKEQKRLEGLLVTIGTQAEVEKPLLQNTNSVCRSSGCRLPKGHDNTHLYTCGGRDCPGMPYSNIQLAHPATCWGPARIGGI